MIELLSHPSFKDCKTFTLKGYSNGNTDYKKAKKPIVKWQTVNSLTEKELKEALNRGYWIGGAIPDSNILIDVDSKDKGLVLYEGLLKACYKFIGIETPNGYQFVFKDTGRVIKQDAKMLTVGGMVVDYRLARKGYTVLPTYNTEGRKVIFLPEGNLDNMPLCFRPVRGIKETDSSIELDMILEGSRSTILISHASRIREWNVAHRLNLSDHDKRQILTEVNSILCNPPLPERDIDKIFRSAESYPLISSSQKDISELNEPPITDKDLIPPCPFPFEIFPRELLNVIENLSDALHVAREIVASAMFTILSGAIGNTIRVSPKQGYEVPPFIWLIIIASSGYGKSPVIHTLLKHLNRLQSTTFQKYQKEMKEYEALLKKSKFDPDAEIPDKPKIRHIIVSDCTIEALGNVFENDKRGVISNQDEIAGLILGCDQYKAKGNDRQHYLELFNCDSWKIDRKSGVKFISNTGTAIIGGIQPKVMPKIFNTDSFNDGLLPRFLLLHAENHPLKFNRQAITDDVLAYWNNLITRCYEIPLMHDENDFIIPQVLILNSKALDNYEQFYNAYGNKIPFLSDKARGFIPKLTAYYSLKFAGILHIIRAFSKEAAINHVIDDETIQHAIQLTHYFAGQVIKSLTLYETQDRITEYQRRIIETLYRLQGEVKSGKIQLSIIVDTFNDSLPEPVKHTPEKVRAILSGLGLVTEKGVHNFSFLIWESEKIQKLFSRTTVTTVTSVTQKGKSDNVKVTDVTDVTVNSTTEVLDLSGDDVEILE